MRFIPNNDSVQRAMLAEMGYGSLEELFASIPAQARLGRPLMRGSCFGYSFPQLPP